MAVAYNKFQQFVENLSKGVHDFTSDATCTPTIALCAAANAPVATNSVLADLTQIAYTNLSTRAMTGQTAEHTTGTVTYVIDDLTLTASGGAVATFRYVVLYDDDPTSPADPLIGWWDLGENVTLTDGSSITLNLPGNWATLV